MNKIRRAVISLAVVVIAAKIITVLAILAYPEFIIDQSMADFGQKIVQLTNDYRASLSLSALKVNYRLNQAAVNKAYDLLANNYFSHTSPTGKKFSDWIREMDYQYFYAGENLAIDFQLPEEVFRAWLNSPSHRENIVKPQYEDIGVAALSGKFNNNPTIAVVQLFGQRLQKDRATDDFRPIQTEDLLPSGFWQKIGLNQLKKIDNFAGYLMTVTVGLALITYLPAKRKNQINIKQPITSRYQAKARRE